MKQLQDKTAAPGGIEVLLGGVRTAVIGALIGFAGGFLVIAAMFCLNREERDPERDQEGWALFAAMMFCGGSASVGGMLGFVAGMIGGTRLALKAAVTKGLLGALIAAALGFVAGFLVLLATDFAKGDWAELVLASGLAAFYSGLVGFITGTIVGTCQAARNQSKEKLSTG